MPTDQHELSEIPPISDLYVLSEESVNDEVGRVLDELTHFIHDLLPVIAARDADAFSQQPTDAGPPTVREWQDATIRLRSILNTIDSSQGPPVLDRTQFDRLLWPEPAFDFAIEEGRIRWLLSWSVGLRWVDVARYTCRLPEECQLKNSADIERSMHATQRWMLGLSIRDRQLQDALYELLPAIADRDPSFARFVLEIEAWKERIVATSGLTEAKRQNELARLDGQFRYVLHNAVQHVITALANNHFMEIHLQLEHPEYEGRSSWSTPHQLFAILLAKVEILLDVRRQVREAASKKNVPMTAQGFAAICAQAATKLVEDEAKRPPQPDWDHSDARWREFRYVDYIAHKSAEEQERELWQVPRTRFAPGQPKEFSEFAGCSAHLDLKALDLNEDRQMALRVGLAGSGVRVPGTKFLLRVARPWYAYFEERRGEFPTLPHNWMEALHLSKSGWEEEYEWIGRRHDWIETVIHWNRYEETPSGWRLKPRPAPQLSDAQWQAEIDRVANQTTEFIDKLLPAIAARDPEIFTAHLEPDAGGWTERLRTIDEWASAASRIRGILNAELTPMPRVLDLDEFKWFTWGAPSIDYLVENGRIHWKISCYAEVDWLSAVHSYFRRDFDWPPKDESHPGYSIEATKQWLLAASVQKPILWNALTAGALPAVADYDPQFARRLLDLDDWRRRIETNPAFDESERKVELAEFEGMLRFKLVVHNANLHVIGSLANNHFSEIRSWIEHPCFVGGYTPLVPHYLFANLLAKAHTIQKHCPNKGNLSSSVH